MWDQLKLKAGLNFSWGSSKSPTPPAKNNLTKDFITRNAALPIISTPAPRVVEEHLKLIPSINFEQRSGQLSATTSPVPLPRYQKQPTSPRGDESGSDSELEAHSLSPRSPAPLLQNLDFAPTPEDSFNPDGGCIINAQKVPEIPLTTGLPTPSRKTPSSLLSGIVSRFLHDGYDDIDSMIQSLSPIVETPVKGKCWDWLGTQLKSPDRAMPSPSSDLIHFADLLRYINLHQCPDYDVAAEIRSHIHRSISKLSPTQKRALFKQLFTVESRIKPSDRAGFNHAIATLPSDLEISLTTDHVQPLQEWVVSVIQEAIWSQLLEGLSDTELMELYIVVNDPKMTSQIMALAKVAQTKTLALKMAALIKEINTTTYHNDKILLSLVGAYLRYASTAQSSNSKKQLSGSEFPYITALRRTISNVFPLTVNPLSNKIDVSINCSQETLIELINKFGQINIDDAHHVLSGLSNENVVSLSLASRDLEQQLDQLENPPSDEILQTAERNLSLAVIFRLGAFSKSASTFQSKAKSFLSSSTVNNTSLRTITTQLMKEVYPAYLEMKKIQDLCNEPESTYYHYLGDLGRISEFKRIRDQIQSFQGKFKIALEEQLEIARQNFDSSEFTTKELAGIRALYQEFGVDTSWTQQNH